MKQQIVLNESILPTATRLKLALPHGLLLSGERGVGLFTIARSFTQGTPIILKPKLQTKTSSTAQISVDDIRELYELTRSKNVDRLFVIIDDSDSMTVPAQNALLKLLEEPQQDVRFLLTSHNPTRLLQTIRSRVQEVHVPNTPLSMTESLLAGVPDAKKRQIQFIAGGLPAEVHRLIDDELYFRDRVHVVTLAKRLLEATKYDAAAELMKSSVARADALDLIEMMIRLLSISPDTSGAKRVSRLLDAHQSIAANGHIKLQLIGAVIQ